MLRLVNVADILTPKPVLELFWENVHFSKVAITTLKLILSFFGFHPMILIMIYALVRNLYTIIDINYLSKYEPEKPSKRLGSVLKYGKNVFIQLTYIQM